MTDRPPRWVYKTALWQRMRLQQLRDEPLCRYCAEMGRVVPATVVDHIAPHRGDRDRAFDQGNLQSVCKPCHDRLCQIKDSGRPVPGCGDDGYPMDLSHPWHGGGTHQNGDAYQHRARGVSKS